MKYYSVDIQVDFDTAREMPPRSASGKNWRAVGYFQYFFCTENSKEKAKQLVLDFVRKNESDPGSCKCKCDRIAWMRGLKNREQIVSSFTADITEEMFEKRNQIGIWYSEKKAYFVSEADAVASMLNGM